MRKKLWADTGFVVTEDYCGLVDLDKWPARNLLEDLGLLRGYAVFEVMEAKNGIVFHFEEHFERLKKSMTELRMPISQVFLGDGIKKTIEFNKIDSALVYVLVTGGSTYDGFHPSTPSNFYILVRPFLFPRLKKDGGLKLRTVNYCREFPGIKTTNYLAAEVAGFFAGVAGYNDILYAPGGILLECSKANFFIAKTLPNGRVIINTSFLKDEDDTPFVLPGVTRELVLKLAEKEGYLAAESLLMTKDLQEAEEVFVASTTLGVWPVVKIDKKEFPVGPITKKLRKEFLKYRGGWYKNQRS